MTTLTLPPWRSATPTQPGVYRYRGENPGFWLGNAETPVWCEVWFHVKPRVGQVWFFNKCGTAILKLMRGQWQGPIVVEDDHA